MMEGDGAQTAESIPVRDTREGARAGALDALLFDLDGTLIDTVGLILESMRYSTRAVLDRELPDDELMRHVGAPLLEVMRRIEPSKAETLVQVYREYNHEIHDEMVARYPGVEEALAAFAEAGVPMGVVTSKARGIALRGLDLFGFRSFFDVIVCSDDVPVHKPDPYPLRVAARALGVELERCAYIGDSPYDMTAAIAGGAISVAALWGAFPTAMVLQPGPRYAAAEARELVEWFFTDSEKYRVWDRPRKP